MSLLEKWLKSSKAYWPTPTRWATFASFPLIPIIISHILLLLCTRYIAWPENLLWPHLSFHNLALYKDIFFIYPPLYFEIISVFSNFFGLTLISLISLSYLNIIFTDTLLYFVGKKRILPLIIFIPLQIFFEGNAFWPDQLLAPIFLAGWLCFQHKKYFLLGLFLGLALITKQTAAYFIFGIFILFIFSKAKLKNYVKLLIGSLIPIIILILYLIFNQNYREFFEQTIIYIFSYHTKNTLQILWPNKQQIISTLLIFFPVLFSKNYKLIFLAILASLGIFTRFEYFHLQPALPFIALILSETFVSIPFLLVFAVLFIRFVFTSHGLPTRFYDTELKNNARKINLYIPAGSKALFINTWDHYYYLTNTIPLGNFFYSSTPWNWEYGDLQVKTVEILKREKPKYVVYGSCFKINEICYQPAIVKDYIKANYKQVSETSDGTGIFEYNPVSF